jgi:hypothetical protein
MAVELIVKVLLAAPLRIFVRICTVLGWSPLPVTTMSGSPTSSDVWLLVTETFKDANPDNAPAPDTLAIWMSCPVSVNTHPAAGMPEMVGAVLSMLIPLKVAGALFPARHI